MSALVGLFPPHALSGERVGVWASRGGVELSPEQGSITLTPLEARAMAHALIAASEEVERMRDRPEAP